MTSYPDFFKRLYQKHIPGQVDTDWITLFVPIGSAKESVQVEFNSDAPTL